MFPHVHAILWFSWFPMHVKTFSWVLSNDKCCSTLQGVQHLVVTRRISRKRIWWRTLVQHSCFSWWCWEYKKHVPKDALVICLSLGSICLQFLSTVHTLISHNPEWSETTEIIDIWFSKEYFALYLKVWCGCPWRNCIQGKQLYGSR